MSSSSEIKVIVKTPTQKTEDQIVKCSLDWTVSELKKYISENFTSKPAVNDQRLIYSGRLLKEQNTLKEVFQPTEQDDSTFTVHLVFNQKDVTENKIKNEKNQNVSNGSNESSSNLNLNQSIPNFPNVNMSQFNINLNDPLVDYTSLYVQQMQQYQQMYVNYMTQFLAYNNLEQPSQTNVYNTTSVASLPMSPMIINPFFFNPFLTAPTNFANLTPLIQSNLNNNSTESGTSNNQQAANNEEANERLNDNQAQLNNENEVDNQNNGIIDMMNIFWNILILFSLISTSLSRTLFVLGISCLYYVYQTGFFTIIYIRIFGNRDVNNRNVPNNEDQIQQMMDNVETPGLRRRNVDANSQNDANTDINNNQTQQNFMIDKFRFFFMVVSSLFSSLMPNNGPIVPAN